MGVKISALPPVVTPSLTDVFPIVQSGVTYKESGTQLSSLFATAGANTNITSLGGLTTPLSVPQGGTGAATFTPYAVVVGGTSTVNPLQSVASVGTTGYVLTSNGAGANPTFQASASNASAWVAYTPTFTGFGIVSNVQIWSRQQGDTLQIRGRFDSGTSTGVEAQMTLGFNGTNANITSSSTLITDIQMAGPGTIDAGASANYIILIEANTGYVTFGIQNSTRGGLTKCNGSTLVSNGNTLGFVCDIPCDTFP